MVVLWRSVRWAGEQLAYVALWSSGALNRNSMPGLLVSLVSIGYYLGMAPETTSSLVAFDILSRVRKPRVLSALDHSVINARSLFPGKDGYRQFGFVELLTPDGYNPKTKKGRARGYSTAIMHFAPAEP